MLPGSVFVQRQLSIQLIVVAVVPTFIFINLLSAGWFISVMARFSHPTLYCFKAKQKDFQSVQAQHLA